MTTSSELKQYKMLRLNKLGETGINLSHISFGGAAFSNFYGQSNEIRGIELLKTCLQRGINYIDTAPWYGQGSSEVTCGKALKGLPRELFYIGTKVGRYELDVRKMFDFSAEKSHASVELSLQRLGLDYVDIIQVHDLTFAPDISVILKETLPALAKEVERGHARYIGLADYDLSLLKELVEETEVKIASVLSYAKSTMIDNRLQKYVQFFQRNGVGVINAAGNAMGLLTNKGPQSWHPASEHTRGICRQAAEYCQDNGVELARLAQWFTLSQSNIATNVLGIQELVHLDQALDVLENGLTEHEQKIYTIIQERFFQGKTLHWDNVELPIYREKMAKLSNV